MPPKATTITITTSGLGSRQTDTSMLDASSADTEWLKDNMQYLIENQDVLKERLDAYRHQPVKMPLIKKFNRNRLKLKGFLV